MNILPPSPEDHTQDATFVEVYVRTRDPVLAVVRAGITDTSLTQVDVAQKMLARPEIQSAISAVEKLTDAGPQVEITRESILADLQVVYERALAAGEHNACISAKKTQALIKNLINQNINVTHRQVAADMTDDELTRLASQRLKDASIPGEVVPARRGIGHLSVTDEE